MATEKRLIYLEDAIEVILEESEICNSGFTRNVLELLAIRVEAIPVRGTAELVRCVCKEEDEIDLKPALELMHGRWEKVQEWATKAKYRCSICGREIMSARVVNVEKYPYCHCGAKMDGAQE